MVIAVYRCGCVQINSKVNSDENITNEFGANNKILKIYRNFKIYRTKKFGLRNF